MMKVTANGKTFTFPDGTSTEDIGTAIDEYFAGQAVQQQTVNQANNAPTREEPSTEYDVFTSSGDARDCDSVTVFDT
jgi:hypothetical protein